MIDTTFAGLESVNDFLWGYVGVALILGGGALVSHQLGWVQLRAPTHVLLTALSLLRQPSSDTSNQESKRGVDPARAFFASLGGCVGIGNLAGAMVGGMLLGLIEALGAGYIGDLTGGVFGSNYQDVFAFIVLIGVLLFRPSGIMGERVADRA